MPFKIIRNDISKVKADAIVNSANSEPVAGSGCEGAIYEAAGKELLLEARRKIGRIEQGGAAATAAFGLNAKYIIHTVGPVWIDGKHGERGVLEACYGNSLRLAEELGCESVAFPLISGGNCGFPKGTAVEAAVDAIGRFLRASEMKVTLVVLSRKALEISERLTEGVERFIDENAADEIISKEYARNLNYRAVLAGRRERDDLIASESDPPVAGTLYSLSGKTLDEILVDKEDSFRARLFKLMDEKKIGDVEFYKKANIDRKVFSRMRVKEDYKPTKMTALASAIALELDLPATADLLARAGIALSPSSKFDLIVSYFIMHGDYDINKINTVLFKYGQPAIGC